MFIKTIISQHRRDFKAVYMCEHCGHERDGSGYDDSYFHCEIIPHMTCEKCGKIAGENYRPRPTKYPEGMQV